MGSRSPRGRGRSALCHVVGYTVTADVSDVNVDRSVLYGHACPRPGSGWNHAVHDDVPVSYTHLTLPTKA